MWFWQDKDGDNYNVFLKDRDNQFTFSQVFNAGDQIFDAIESGLVGLDETIKISKKAEVEPPAKLGLQSGQEIKLRYLLRAAAVKGANDASTAIAEGIDGSEAAFARRMNGYSQELGWHCQIKQSCLMSRGNVAILPCLIHYPSAISKPALRSSNLQLCCM